GGAVVMAGKGAAAGGRHAADRDRRRYREAEGGDREGARDADGERRAGRAREGAPLVDGEREVLHRRAEDAVGRSEGQRMRPTGADRRCSGERGRSVTVVREVEA